MLKKILIKNNDCIALMNNVSIFSNARGKTKYSKIDELEIQIIVMLTGKFYLMNC